ncbi:PREDICTED: SRA stem-loop-interacting RNA-binding protein, mitochondrial [Gavialis gangeticus]|uniref:SRA stem-loop-interacting RNA-binding protein, mitochondrial n=1 Tax=Gavialis gangeticus TaxID=94835 RepID=UPI00092F0CB1|nr:PREDICTED: SRA stem-loop-interacting RNA-binding protein, mitochondrial [Gavialis gangeticus]
MAARELYRKILVRRLPWTVGRFEVSEYFKQFGSIKRCNVPFDETGFNKGYSWITFHSESSIHKVLKESHTLEGAQVTTLLNP